MKRSLIEQEIELAPFNTLALPGRAAAYARIETVEALTDPALQKYRRFLLGGGSNLVLRGDFDGLVLHIGIPGRRLLFEDADAWYLEGSAGENWHEFVLWTLQQGCPGLENLALIPGTLGAAPIQNIGAYGLEVGELIHLVRTWDFRSRTLVDYGPKDCRFAYRQSIFKEEGRHLDGSLAIVSLVLRLPKVWRPRYGYADLKEALASRGIAQPSAQDIAEAVITLRQRKLPDPRVLPNAGSFFHNPIVPAAQAEALKSRYPNLPTYPQPDGRVKLAAGWLIDQAGWKGKRLGPIGMYEQQALVLVNHGNARGTDVERCMAAVQADVRERFGVELMPEPVFL